MAAIEMQQYRATPGEASQGDAVALLVGQLELGRRLPQQRLAAGEVARTSKECANSAQCILR